MTQGPKELEARIARLFVEQLQVDLSSSEVDLFENGLLDSWRLVVLLGALETEFGVRVAMDELEFDDFRTLAQIASFVAARVPPMAELPPS
jgi:acyl carrier protein